MRVFRVSGTRTSRTRKSPRVNDEAPPNWSDWRALAVNPPLTDHVKNSITLSERPIRDCSSAIRPVLQLNPKIEPKTPLGSLLSFRGESSKQTS